MTFSLPDLYPFLGKDSPRLTKALPAPPWRNFTDEARQERGKGFQVKPEAVEVVNAALLLRRPLLVTGKPGTGKTSLAYAVAEQLGLGNVLHWPITTRTTLQQGLYAYDAIGRLQEASRLQSQPPDQSAKERQLLRITEFLRLGPLGTALIALPKKPKIPRVLVIDEIDKGDIDLPNDLLHVFEEGEFEIPELSRLAKGDSDFKKALVRVHDGDYRAQVRSGRVRCDVFPFVVMTSNGEREFPPAFHRRCLRLEIKPPDEKELLDIVQARFNLGKRRDTKILAIITKFLNERDVEKQELATDQLLNAVHLVLHGASVLDREELREAIFRPLRKPT